MKHPASRFISAAVRAGLLLGLAATPAAAQSPQSNTATSGWHANATIYFWAQGVHGDASALGHTLGINATAGDLISDADYAAEGLVGIQYRRLLMLSDFSWTPLTVDKSPGSVPSLPPGVALQAKFKPLLITPELGYRLIQRRSLTLDGLAGVRYWHMGTTIALIPSPTGTSQSKSMDWTDPLLGARVQYWLSPRLVARVAGDIGGFSVGSRLDDQLVGGFSYRLLRRWAIDAAWRSLYVDYKQDQFHSRTTESGFVLGVTFGGK